MGKLLFNAPRMAAAMMLVSTAWAATVMADAEAVHVELIEGTPNRTWQWKDLPAASRTWRQEAMGFVAAPRKYSDEGQIEEYSHPFLIRATARVMLDAGEHQVLLRSFNAARLTVDGQVVATTRFIDPNPDGHEPVPDQPGLRMEAVREMRPGHAEAIATIRSPGGEHEVRLEAFVGGKGLRHEVGELSASVRHAGSKEPFIVLSPSRDVRVALTEEGWASYAESQMSRIAQLDAARRRMIDEALRQQWSARHEFAKQYASEHSSAAVPDVPADYPAHNDVDRFIAAKLIEAGVRPAPLTEDAAFLRRVTLDVVGRLPTVEEIDAFAADRRPEPARRAAAIDHLLDDSEGWANHWVAYWQDVLAENPSILKPMLNNTGPFRWWIYESFLDNKPFDRFVTELVLMGGDRYAGAAAGFTMASQNDVPMAEKANIIGQAFLGVNMTCARCHDAPFHDVKQGDLFALAAMLEGKSIKLPESSTVPGSPEAIERMVVTVSLKPGESVKPRWTLSSIVPTDAPTHGGPIAAPDSRKDLAALLTTPANERFAQVIVNRMWRRYLGHGLVEPVDDWQDAKPSHPALLQYLSHELVTNGYDLKHVARLILNSHTYQRQVVSPLDQPAEKGGHLFASPVRRRMSAEQVVDSLFAVSGKPMRAEQMNLDVDGRRPIRDFLNLGVPTRAWQFASLSNERDRPALAMPYAQSIVDVLATFGWRESRQNPLTVRDDSPTVQQPAILANGLMAGRITRLSEDSAFTALALAAGSPAEFVDAVFLRMLSRQPTDAELNVFVAAISEGFDKRRVEPAPGDTPATVNRTVSAVSWSNHLSAEATSIKQELERFVRAGDPPTPRLEEDWRQRAEDVIWALLNSPEFIFIP